MSDLAGVVENLHPHEVRVLTALSSSASEGVTAEHLSSIAHLEVAQVGAAIGRLQLKDFVHITHESSIPMASLTTFGKVYSVDSPIARILSALDQASQNQTSLTLKSFQETHGFDASEISGAIGDLKKEDVIRIKPGGVLELTGKTSATFESLRALISRLEAGLKPLEEFSSSERILIERFAQKRGKPNEPFRIDELITRRYALSETGKRVIPEIQKADSLGEEAAALTPEMLKDGSWRHVRFRKYAIGPAERLKRFGKKHPYREFLDLVKAKFVGMGFEEMRGPLVENEFWDMDALYMPQFHPARDIHDVYFVKEPTHSSAIREPFLRQVKQAHETGWKTGSTGWGYRFDPMRARRLVLRSQGTAVSARTLAGKPKVPGKYFSIARCFRYDQVDATHAPDFYQIEGIVLGEDINFRTLLGLLNLFAREIAQAQESKFLPAYFPFTEPSVELHVRHPRLGWMELGGAGLFRPEVTQPLGVNIPVIAWGLGLDRMAMVALEIHDIRDLFSADLEMIRSKRVQY